MNVLAGVFRSEGGIEILNCIDEAVFYGKRDSSFDTYSKKMYDEYATQMNMPALDSKIQFQEVIRKLNKQYKTYDLNDRYVLCMDCIRELFHEHLTKKKPRKKQLKTYEKSDRTFRLRNRHRLEDTKTVISETTSVASKFSRT